MTARRACLVAAIWTTMAIPRVAAGQETGRATPLRAGAAKVDVTPTESELPQNYLGVLDRVYARAIVLERGADRAALITVDAGLIPDGVWQAVTRQIETELGIPSDNVLLTATHTHSVPGAQSADYARKIVDAARLARQKLVPARVGFGTGESYINVNRQITDLKTGRWREGPNREGPSDKTVAVLKFESLTGEPLAVYYNYAVHGVIAGQLDQISGDIPGASSRYVEDALGGSVVAVWSTGAAGDQNPIYFQQTYDLREIRIKDYAKRGIDISNAMPPGGQGLDPTDPRVARLMSQQRQMVSLLRGMIADLGYAEAVHARPIQCFLDIVQPVRSDEARNQLHAGPSNPCFQRDRGTCRNRSVSTWASEASKYEGWCRREEPGGSLLDRTGGSGLTQTGSPEAGRRWTAD